MSEIKKITAYIINMSKDRERKDHMQALFQSSNIKFNFINAVVGKSLPDNDPRYNDYKYRMAHGKRMNKSELGCYLSHLKALQQFLDDGNSYGLICEDDLTFDCATFERVLAEALQHDKHFDFLRLSGLHNGTPISFVDLKNNYHLACNYTRQTGSGAYLVNRKAAQVLLDNLQEMWLPYDHAFDREWSWRSAIKALCIHPFPATQNATFDSTINAASSYKLPAIVRYWTVFPYRFYNETLRIIFRSRQILRYKIFRR